MRIHPGVDVECGECGCTFELSVRNEYAWRKKGLQPRCQLCRRPVAELTAIEREKYVAWWLYESGLEVDELVGIAVGLSALA